MKKRNPTKPLVHASGYFIRTHYEKSIACIRAILYKKDESMKFIKTRLSEEMK